MRREEKERLNRQTRKRYLFLRLRSGCKSLKSSWLKRFVLLAFYAAVPLAWDFGKDRLPAVDPALLSPAFAALAKLLFPITLISGTAFLLILFGTPSGSGRIANGLNRIGLVNSAGETPVLKAKRRDKKKKAITVYTFDGVGIPLPEWENKRPHIEAALNLHVVRLAEGGSKREIRLFAVPAGRMLPERLEWRDSYRIQDSSTLVLGQSLLGKVTVDLAKIPHILLGGSTGSGKSVLLKLLLMQAVKKGALVGIADFKGGVDFPTAWHAKCRMCFDEDALLSLLDELVEELQSRKTLFRENGCPNLGEYNRRTGKELPRYIFACDEVAEVLDKTGLSRDQKEKIARIESRLAVIARQGRAFGIHLILATQRPDAAILPGQIRSNIDCRICGRADSVLSQIILDSTAAAEQIPKDTAGRFLLYDGTTFQAYLFDENSL